MISGKIQVSRCTGVDPNSGPQVSFHCLRSGSVRLDNVSGLPNGGVSLPEYTTGIPTLYHGRRFRSRIEARWAAFFDLANWPWEYEPFDLEGYIPDFVLLLHREAVSQG